ncbi:MAG: STAS domain-containing protein [Phycisphaerales bacterium]|nr:MAG: STAS domain-containing protein [Phycisphaerales bacterium]
MPTEWSDDIVIAELADEPALSDELTGIVQRLESTDARKPSVVLNFAGVSYVNSSNLAQLLKIKSRLKEAGRTLRLCSVSDDVWSVLMVTGLDKVFQFHPDPMTALAAIQIDIANDDETPKADGPRGGRR